MNDQIKNFATQAGIMLSIDYHASEDELALFAKLIRADEREACAMLCESLEIDGRWFSNKIIARGDK